MTELEEQKAFIAGIMDREKDKKRYDGRGKTPKYKMAEGMRQVVSAMEAKKKKLAERQEISRIKADTIEIKRRMDEAEKLL